MHGGPRGAGGAEKVTFYHKTNRSGLSGRALSPRTIDHAMVKLLAIVTEAAEAGLCSLKACDFKAVKKALPRPTAHQNGVKAEALSQEQTDVLLGAVRGHWLGPVIRFALASGARRGEICALQWKRVSFKGRVFGRGEHLSVAG